MPDWTEHQGQHTDQRGLFWPIQYCAIDVSGDGGVEPSAPKPMDTREKPEANTHPTETRCKVIAVTRILTGYRQGRDPRRRRL